MKSATIILTVRTTRERGELPVREAAEATSTSRESRQSPREPQEATA